MVTRDFAQNRRILNMIMTLLLIPQFHYNTITETNAWFLFSLLEGLSIDSPSQMILSILDTYLDTASREKLILPSFITQLLTYFHVSFLSSSRFYVMGALGKVTLSRTRSSSQLIVRAKRPRDDSTLA